MARVCSLPEGTVYTLCAPSFHAAPPTSLHAHIMPRAHLRKPMVGRK